MDDVGDESLMMTRRRGKGGKKFADDGDDYCNGDDDELEEKREERSLLTRRFEITSEGRIRDSLQAKCISSLLKPLPISSPLSEMQILDPRSYRDPVGSRIQDLHLYSHHCL